MEANPKPGAPVRCEICLKEVPPSEALSAEACDYVIHFCGVDCYRVWAERKVAAAESATSEARS